MRMKNGGVNKVRSRDEEERRSTNEGSVVGVVKRLLRCWKEEPRVGRRVKGKRLVVFGRDVVDTMEEKPWFVLMFVV